MTQEIISPKGAKVQWDLGYQRFHMVGTHTYAGKDGHITWVGVLDKDKMDRVGLAGEGVFIKKRGPQIERWSFYVPPGALNQWPDYHMETTGTWLMIQSTWTIITTGKHLDKDLLLRSIHCLGQDKTFAVLKRNHNKAFGF